MPKKRIKKSGKYDVLLDGVTNSLLQKWLMCRQAARYYIDGLRSDRPKTKALLGSIFHELLEHWYMDGSCPFKKVEARLRDKFLEEGGDLQMLESLLAQAHGLFEVYKEHWAKADAKKDWIETESVFDVEWEGWRLRGMRDGLYRDRKSKKLWLLETKTKSRIPESLDTSLVFDPQNLFYITATEAELDEEIAGVCYNIIRQPSLRQKQSENTADFFRRIKDDVADRQEHYFLRYELRYSKKQKDAFKNELLLKLDDMYMWTQGGQHTYKAECSCARGWSCDYLERCANGGVGGPYVKGGVLFEELQDAAVKE